MPKRALVGVALLMVGTLGAVARAAPPDATALQAPAGQESAAALIAPIQARWAVVQYTLPKTQQASQFAALAQKAADLANAHPALAEPLVWEGIVLASDAGATGGLSALFLAKRARACLDAAVRIDGVVLDGSAYTTLGSLYAQVPGWPIGFGDKAKAETYFKKALAINPLGIDDNYFYASYLAAVGRKSDALRHLDIALHAAPRPGRALADKGRRQQILALIARLSH